MTDNPSSDVGRETLNRFSGMDRTNRWLFDALRPDIGQRVLEAGSGIGNLTQFMIDRERVVCVDLDPHHLEILGDRFAGKENVTCHLHDVSQGDLLSLAREAIDTIVCVNVLEHIEDDVATLRNFHEILQPGGKLVLLAPAMPSLYCSLDVALGHHRRYTPRHLASRVEEAGFRLLRTRYLNLFGIPGWLLSGKVLKREILPSGALGLFNTLVPLFRLIEHLTGPPLGVSVIAVGQK